MTTSEHLDPTRWYAIVCDGDSDVMTVEQLTTFVNASDGEQGELSWTGEGPTSIAVVTGTATPSWMADPETGGDTENRFYRRPMTWNPVDAPMDIDLEYGAFEVDDYLPLFERAQLIAASLNAYGTRRPPTWALVGGHSKEYYTAQRDADGGIRLSSGRGALIADRDHTRADVQGWFDRSEPGAFREGYRAALRLLDEEAASEAKTALAAAEAGR